MLDQPELAWIVLLNSNLPDCIGGRRVVSLPVFVV